MAMRRLLSVAAAALLSSSAEGRSGLAQRTHGDVAAGALTEKYPFYHTSASLVDEANSLAANCSGLSISSPEDSGASVPVAHLAALGGDAEGQSRELKVMMVFGEHARELISPETGFAWLQKLCGPEGAKLREQTSS
jgi:hypothetical protein